MCQGFLTMAHLSPLSSPVLLSSPYRSPSPTQQTSASSASSALSLGSDYSPYSPQRKRKVCRRPDQQSLKKKCIDINQQQSDEERDGVEGEVQEEVIETDETDSDSAPSSPNASSVGSSFVYSSSDESSRSTGGSESEHSSASDNSSDGESFENEPLYERSALSNVEALLKVLKLFVKMGWSKKSLDLNLKLIKELLPQPNELPSSSSAALSTLEKLTSSCCEEEYLCCKTCGSLVDTCDHSDGFQKFYSFPVGEQIKHMFEHRSLASAVESYRHSKKDGYLTDISDGVEYCKIKEHLQNPYDLMLLWNTDGAEMSSSSKQEMWPILCTICEVPPRLRPSFLIVAGVFVGEKKPRMNVFLKPFADSLIKLWQSGLTWVHPVLKTQQSSKVVAPVLSADAPAKALVNNCMNHNAKYGCNICEQKTKKIPLSAEEVAFNTTAPARKKKRRKRRFVFQEGDAPLRTAERIELLAATADRTGKSRKGINGLAVVSSIPFMDRANFIGAEYLHVVLLGCVKYLLNIIISTRGKWYLGDKIEEMDLFIDSIKVPSFVKRLPRGFKCFKYWKGSDFRSFLLYYSLPLFKRYMSEEYFQHWLLLVGAINILLKDSITEVELDSSRIMLRAFVRDISHLYGDSCYTYNMHNLLHLPLLVLRWGPLWATSAFVFESCNGFISRHVHGTKHLGKELINYIKISQSVAVLDNIVNSNCLELNTIARLSCPLGKVVFYELLTNEEQNVCSILLPYVVYRRAKLFDGEVYTTKGYDSHKKRGDSFVKFRNADNDLKYGQIIYFLKPENASLHCLVRVMTVSHLHLFYHLESRFVVRSLIPVSDSEELILIPVEHVISKVLKIGMYLGMPPNSYEINL